MARILDATEFITNHTGAREDRRTDVFMSWLDKTPSFSTYYSIDKILSTSEIGNMTIDDYIGPNSPVKYNKIKDFPIYGVSQFNTESEYDEEMGLLTDFTGEGIILPNTSVPCEGDVFYINGLTFKALMVVNEVREQSLLGRSHYIIAFHSTYPAKINLVEQQLSHEYTAVYDNIGTEEHVVLDDGNLLKLQMLSDLYNKLDQGYKSLFFDRKASILKVPITEMLSQEKSFLVDKYLLMFMKDNRIIEMDKVLKNSFVLDNNSLFNNLDIFEYSSTLFYNLKNRRTKLTNIKDTDAISLKRLMSPLALYTRRGTPDDLMFPDKYIKLSDIPEDVRPLHTTYGLGTLITYIKTEDVIPDPDPPPIGPFPAPGPTILRGGTMQAGFFGEVPATQLFTAIELADLCDLDAGIVQYNDTPWLKFAWKGDVIFIPKKPIRYFVSWENINNVGAVYGTKLVHKNNTPYAVSLMEGAVSNPSDNSAADRDAIGSMWNQLILPIHEFAYTNSWSEVHLTGDVVPWEHTFGTGEGNRYSNGDLLLDQVNGNGSYTWCKETTDANVDHRVVRGGTGPAKSNWAAKWISYAYSGWRPVLTYKGTV